MGLKSLNREWKRRSWLAAAAALALVLSLLPASDVHANGGPADVSPNAAVGGIQFVQKKSIALKEEKLSFVIVGDQVKINVAYTLKNGGAADKVGFAFPVDFYEPEYGCDPNCSYKADQFQIKDGSKVLPVTSELKESEVDELMGDDYIVKKVSRLYKTTISFAEKEEKVLSVTYSVKAGFVDWGMSDRYSTMFGDRQFSYDLTPAGYWGNGKVDKLSLSVDYRDIVNKGGSLLKLSFPYGKASKEGLFEAQLTQADLKALGEILFQYEYGDYLRSREIRTKRVPVKQMAKITASSTLGASYPVANLFDDKLSTTWAEGVKGLGVGQKLTVEMKEPTFVASIQIANGYMKSKETYLNNARIKRMRVELLESTHGDGNYSWTSTEVTLKDRPYNAVAVQRKDYYNLTDSLMEIVEHEVKAIRLTILETYPGQKYQDTCISELFLLQY